ncbi:hypothetical protein ACFT8W_00110 [Streptomyces hygroscopicus]|uniref:hypothetical protein n=1 Tax=Streptomyces hygroscopicus TaxID=1912 RepID=UPI003626F43F
MGSDLSFVDLTRRINPIVRGWMQYTPRGSRCSSAAREHPVTRGEPHPIPAELAFQHRDLMTQREALRVLVLVAHRQQPQQGEHVRRTQIGTSKQHNRSSCRGTHQVPRAVFRQAQGLWAHIKRSLANLAARALSELETLLRRRLRGRGPRAAAWRTSTRTGCVPTATTRTRTGRSATPCPAPWELRG